MDKKEMWGQEFSNMITLVKYNVRAHPFRLSVRNLIVLFDRMLLAPKVTANLWRTYLSTLISSTSLSVLTECFLK
jgi:hypothetical protein